MSGTAAGTVPTPIVRVESSATTPTAELTIGLGDTKPQISTPQQQRQQQPVQGAEPPASQWNDSSCRCPWAHQQASYPHWHEEAQQKAWQPSYTCKYGLYRTIVVEWPTGTRTEDRGRKARMGRQDAPPSKPPLLPSPLILWSQDAISAGVHEAGGLPTSYDLGEREREFLRCGRQLGSLGVVVTAKGAVEFQINGERGVTYTMISEAKVAAETPAELMEKQNKLAIESKTAGLEEASITSLRENRVLHAVNDAAVASVPPVSVTPRVVHDRMCA